jgi:acyl-homoserine-lactone acylase
MRGERVWAAAALISITAAPAGAGEATLYRDTWGVPHVYADSEAAGYHALGYAQAEDRLVDIYLAIREATGRMAEVKGKGALENDYLMRLFHNDTLHEKYLLTAPKHVQDAIRGFAAGIRAYVAEHPDEAADVKLEIEDWHPLAVGRAMILRWPIGTMMSDLRNVPKPVKPAMGSNQWAVAPKRSADGRAILLTLPRVLGYIFNPVSFYFCFDAAGVALCALAQGGVFFYWHGGNAGLAH